MKRSKKGQSKLSGGRSVIRGGKSFNFFSWFNAVIERSQVVVQDSEVEDPNLEQEGERV